MKTNYEVRSELKNLVTSFDTEKEAENYLLQYPDRKFYIRENKSFTGYDWLGLILIGLLAKFLGLTSALGVLVAYYLNKHLSKKMNKYASILLSSIVGILVYLISAFVLLQIITK